MSDCIFCRIINGEIPAKIIFENDKIISFADIEPQAPFHVLVVPKKHYSNILEVDSSDSVFGDVKNAVAQIIEKEDLASKGFRLVVNTGPEGGQTVNHLHFHLLAGRNMQWPPG